MQTYVVDYPKGTDYSAWIFWLLVFFFIIFIIGAFVVYFRFFEPAVQLLTKVENTLDSVNNAAPVVQQAASDLSNTLIPKVVATATSIDDLIAKIEPFIPTGSDVSTLRTRLEAAFTSVENFIAAIESATGQAIILSIISSTITAGVNKANFNSTLTSINNAVTSSTNNTTVTTTTFPNTATYQRYTTVN